jgi:hypothetical protein
VLIRPRPVKSSGLKVRDTKRVAVWPSTAGANADADLASEGLSGAIREVLPKALLVALLLWMSVVTVRAIPLVLRTFDIDIPAFADTLPNYATLPMLWGAALVYLVCLLAALITRRLRPASTVGVTITVGAICFLTAAIATSTFGSVLVTLVMFCFAWLVGDIVVTRFLSSVVSAMAQVVVAIALGLGALGLLLLALVTLGRLSVTTILAAGVVILAVAIVIHRERLWADLQRNFARPPAIPTWWETIILGLLVGLIAFALLASLVPEDQSDAIRQHLPIAREIWQTGAAPEFIPLGASRAPIEAHLFFTVAYGFGGVAAAKLVHTFVGLTAVAGIAAIGWLCSGRVAAYAGAAIFATMPIVLWEFGHAYTDLFPVLFTVAAALCVLSWQRDGATGWLICAGVLAASGFAAKLTMLWMIAALGAALFLVGRSPWRWRERLLALASYGVGTVVIVPWLARSYGITGTLPGFSNVIEQLRLIVPQLQVPAMPSTAPAPGLAAPVNEFAVNASSSTLYGRTPFDMRRTPLDLVVIPWQVTFHGEVYHSQGAGDIGVAQLMLLPLSVFSPRTRATAFLAVTAVLSYVAWWLTPQITRHLLPTLAISAALIGCGMANLVAAEGSRAWRFLGWAAQVGLILACVAAPFLYLPNWKTTLPVDLFLGRETAAEYVTDDITSAGALLAAGDRLPADAPVGYFGMWEGPQIYTESRLFYLAGQPLGATVDEVLHNLDRLGIRYLVWNRAETRPEDWRSTVLSTDFLRDHARILVGVRNAYVFQILPVSDQPWGQQLSQNLLKDPGLDRVGRDDVWTTEGKVKSDKGVVSLKPRTAMSQRVPAQAGQAYLLVARGACENDGEEVRLSLHWFDAQGKELGEERDVVLPGTEPSDQFIWRRAPSAIASVSAEVVTVRSDTEGICRFDDVNLYELS